MRRNSTQLSFNFHGLYIHGYSQFPCSLHDVFTNTADLNGNAYHSELPADGVILDLAYSPERCGTTNELTLPV